jgi:hypothetical protein
MYGVSDAKELMTCIRYDKCSAMMGKKGLILYNKCAKLIGRCFSNADFLTNASRHQDISYILYVHLKNGKENYPRILYIVLYVHMKNEKENYPRIFDIFFIFPYCTKLHV